MENVLIQKINNARLWKRLIRENHHLNDREQTLQLSREVGEEIAAYIDALTTLIIFFRHERLPYPTVWHRTVCPNQIRAAELRLRRLSLNRRLP